jgi:hypothetical protein
MATKIGEKQKMTEKIKRERYMVAISAKDITYLKEDLIRFDGAYKNISKTIQSIQKCASFKLSELPELTPERIAKYQYEKLDAIALDLTHALSIIAIGMRVCADYAVKSAYANRYLWKRFTILEKTVSKIAKKTGVNISDMKKEIAEVKHFLNSSEFTNVASMFKKAMEEAEKIKERGAANLDYLTRSH